MKTKKAQRPEPTIEEIAERDRINDALREADTDYDGLGIIFRVSNPNNRKLGRMTVVEQEFQGAMKTHSKAVAQNIAESFQGRVVPHIIADRMATKRCRRQMGLQLPWILHDLPQRQR